MRTYFILIATVVLILCSGTAFGQTSIFNPTTGSQTPTQAVDTPARTDDTRNYEINNGTNDGEYRIGGIRVSEGEDSVHVKTGNIEVTVDENSEEGEVVIIRIGKTEFEVIEGEDGEDSRVNINRLDEIDNEPAKRKNIETEWFNLNVGVSGIMDANYEPGLPPTLSDLELQQGRSWHINLKIMEQRVNLVQHAVNLKYGINYEWNNLKFANSVTLNPDAASVSYTTDSVDYKKNKLVAQYLQVPIGLNFETNPGNWNRSLHIDVGLFGGFLTNSYVKQKSKAQGKSKVRDLYNLEQWQYGAYAGLGVGWFNLYGKVDLSRFFAENQGPEAHLFRVGIGLIPSKW